MADRRLAADQPAPVDRPAPWSWEDLQQRLSRLPEWHPSSPGWDQRDQPDLPLGAVDAQVEDRARARPEPFTEDDHADRVRHIRGELADARDRGLASDERFFDLGDDRWTTERQVFHRDLVDDLYAPAAGVPCERRAVMAGGWAERANRRC